MDADKICYMNQFNQMVFPAFGWPECPEGILFTADIFKFSALLAVGLHMLLIYSWAGVQSVLYINLFKIHLNEKSQ